MAFSTNPDDLARELWLLKDQVNRNNSVQSAWSSPTALEPYFNILRARQAYFDFPPIESAVFRSTESLSIPNNDETVINWNEATYNTGLVNYSSIIDSSLILINNSYGPNHAVDLMVMGTISFNANSSGRRSVSLMEIPGSTALNFTIVQFAASPGGVTVLPFCSPVTCFASTGLQGFKIGVFQNSGDALTLEGSRNEILVMLLNRRTT